MRFKILYILFLIAAIFYPNLHLPLGVTPRNIMTVVMLVVCIVEDKKLFFDKWFGIFIIFVFGYVMSANMTGYVTTVLRYLIGFYLVGYVGYWSTIILCKKYNGSELIINTFIILGLLDVVVTIGQYYNISLLTNIPQYLNIGVGDEFLEVMEEGEEALGMNLPGLMAHPVYNGYFIGVVGILSLYYLKDGISFIKLVPWGLSVISSYMVQQRGPFYILLIISFYVIFKTIGRKGGKYKVFLQLLLIVVVPIIISLLASFLLGGSSRFSRGMDSTGRENIYRNTLSFIENNFIWGGYTKLRREGNGAPHNLFLNAWVYGGFLGFLAIVWLTLKQFIMIIRLVLKSSVMLNYAFIICGMAFIGFTLNSLLHNSGIITGDIIIWTLWGICVSNVSGFRQVNTLST